MMASMMLHAALIVSAVCVFICSVQANLDSETSAIKSPHPQDGNGIDSRCPTKRTKYPVLLPHETDCNRFYICDGRVAHLKVCKPGLHFNVAVQTCDYPENAKCATGTAKPGKVVGGQCPPATTGHAVLIPHETDCNSFYICDGGVARPKVCRPGLHFNARLQACDYPYNAGCENRVTKPPAGKVVGERCPPPTTGHAVLIPHETDCNSFYICDGGVARPKVCQPGLHFNARLQTCDYPYNAGCESGVLKREPLPRRIQGDEVKQSCPKDQLDSFVMLPHPLDCSMYYICDQGFLHPMICPSQLHFNPTLKVCDFPYNAQCDTMELLEAVGQPSPFCPAVNSQSSKLPIFYRNPSNCSVYYMCSHGLAYEFVCPARLHFNLRKRVCDFEWNVNCKTNANAGIVISDTRKEID